MSWTLPYDHPHYGDSTHPNHPNCREATEEEILAGLEGGLNYRTLFVAALVIALLIAIWVFLMTPLHEG